MSTPISAHKCDYCNMVSLTKSSVLRHERKSCAKNKACGICKHLLMQQETVYNPFHSGNPGSTDYEIEALYCKAQNDKPLDKRVCNCPLFELGEPERD